MDPVPTESSLTELYNSEAEVFHWLGEGDDEVVMTNRDDLDAMRTFLSTPGHLSTPGGVSTQDGDQPRLLEVGSSTGGFLLAAQDHFDVEGVELNAEAAQHARQRGLSVHTGRLADVATPSTPYDVIAALQLVEHLPDPGELLVEARRLLRPGGAVYLATPAIDSASFALLAGQHTHVSSFGHVVLFSKSGMAHWADRHGFVVEHHEHCGGRDFELHDVVTRRLSPHRYVHRQAWYQPRVLYACQVADDLSGGRLSDRFAPKGHPSYQRVLLRLP
jgi:SAM-dependent methyltransferase